MILKMAVLTSLMNAPEIVISYGRKSGRIKKADVAFVLEINMRKTNMNMILMSRIVIPPHRW